MTMGKRKGMGLFLLMCFLLSIAAGCSASKDAAQKTGTTPKDDYVVQLGYRDCDHMTAAVIAKDTGIFDRLGVKVNVTGSGEVAQAMAAGKMDCAYIHVPSSYLAYQKDPRVIMAANNHIGGSWYLVVANNIKDNKDLIGKKVALGTNANQTSASWVMMADRLGIPADPKQYENFDMKDANEFIALKTGQLDGFTTCDPYGSYAEYEKVGKVVGSDGKLPDGDWGVCCGYMMRKDFAKEHPELAKKMLKAHSEALEIIYTNPIKAGKIFAANYKVPEEVGYMTIYRKTVQEGRTLTWEVDPQALVRTFENSKQLGITKWLKFDKLDASFIDTSMMDQAGVDDFDEFIKTKVDPIFPVGMSYEDWKNKALEIDNASSKA